MISVVTFRWGDKFGVEYVNRLRSALERHLHVPHVFHCVADDPRGFDPGIVWYPMMEEHAEMRGTSNRSCFRRIQLYDRKMGDVFGPRILQLDLDLVLVGDVTPLFDRSEPLVIWEQSRSAIPNRPDRVQYNPSMVLFDAGVLHPMWEEFHAAPDSTFAAARAQGWRCSDMAVVNHYLSTRRLAPPTWSEADGVHPYYRVRRHGGLPPGVRVVNFLGDRNPGDVDVQARSPWVVEHWR